MGDLGNVKVSKEGVAQGKMVDTVAKLYGTASILGRSFVVHEVHSEAIYRYVWSLGRFLLFRLSSTCFTDIAATGGG